MNSLAMCLPAVFLVFAAYSGCNVTYTVAFLALAGGMNGMHYSGQSTLLHYFMALPFSMPVLTSRYCGLNLKGHCLWATGVMQIITTGGP